MSFVRSSKASPSRSPRHSSHGGNWTTFGRLWRDSQRCDEDGPATPIIYGGSVSLDAAPALLAQPDVDGLFVGRQALDPKVFAAIAHVQPAVEGVPAPS